MIRPHARDFYYDDTDFETMKATLNAMKDAQADGFVFGILNRDRSNDSSGANGAKSWIDVERNRELIKLAEGMPCTFHRAFDRIPESDWDSALADVVDCGFTSLLTNGGPSSNKAIDCAEKLASLHSRLHLLGARIRETSRFQDIIVGGGVRSTNVQQLRGKTHARVFHSSALPSSNEVVEVSEVAKLKDSLLNACSGEHRNK